LECHKLWLLLGPCIIVSCGGGGGGKGNSCSQTRDKKRSVEKTLNWGLREQTNTARQNLFRDRCMEVIILLEGITQTGCTNIPASPGTF
jgi:hypothetical protein